MKATDLVRVMLKPRRALPFFKRHPWVFAGAIHDVQGEPQPGDEVALCSHAGEFIARGLFNPHSQIRVRLYSWDAGVPLDREFWKARLKSARQLRDELFGATREVTAYRLCNSKAHGMSGLTIDRYDHWLAVQFTSLALAHRNAELNGVSDRWRCERSDAFKGLERLRDAGDVFDVVVLDPPKLARTRTALPQALRAYLRLNRLAVSVLRRGGLLVTCCCSGLVTREDFQQMLSDVAIQSCRSIRILESRGAGPDHPVSPFCPENDYLKCIFCSVD